MGRTIVYVMMCIVMTDWANVLLKIGADRDEFTPSVGKILGLVTNPFVVVGFTLYGLGMILWLSVLAKTTYSTANVAFCVHYIHLMILSRIVFKEAITWNMWVGAILIGVGLFCFMGGEFFNPKPQ